MIVQGLRRVDFLAEGVKMNKSIEQAFRTLPSRMTDRGLQIRPVAIAGRAQPEKDPDEYSFEASPPNGYQSRFILCDERGNLCILVQVQPSSDLRAQTTLSPIFPMEEVKRWSGVFDPVDAGLNERVFWLERGTLETPCALEEVADRMARMLKNY